MRVAMEEVAKKLTLWHTRTFRPILTHEELEPIMEAVGFVPLPMPPAPSGAVAWRGYAFRAAAPETPSGGSLPRPRLPYPRIDGLHLLAYRAFFDALGFYLGTEEVPDLFHVRSMSITREHDRVFDRFYRPMKDCELDNEGIFLYRDGTLDHITSTVCSHSSNGGSDDANGDGDGDDCSNMSRHIPPIRKDRRNNSASSSICLVKLTDLFPSKDIVTLG